MSAGPHVAVLGLGIVGAGIAATLAQRGFRVTGIDQFPPLHDRGSSHGDTRIYRRVPHEGSVYVEMAARSLHGWRRWGALARQQLLTQCGGIDAGPPDSPMVASALRLSIEHQEAYRLLTGAEFNRQYPHFRLPADWHVVHQPASGILKPDTARAFLYQLAAGAGATLLFDRRVTGIDPSQRTIRVHTADGIVHCDFLVLAAGSWLPKLVPDLAVPLTIERRVMAWYRPHAAQDLEGPHFPVFCLDADGGWYGMAAPGGAVKIGHDKHHRRRIDPDRPPEHPSELDAGKLNESLKYFAGFSDRPFALQPCIYTLTADRHFVIDRHPRHAGILVFACCSGHGFKYGPDYGDIAADLIDGRSRPDLTPFSLDRRGSSAPTFGE